MRTSGESPTRLAVSFRWGFRRSRTLLVHLSFYYWPGIKGEDILKGKVKIPPSVFPLHNAVCISPVAKLSLCLSAGWLTDLTPCCSFLI